MIITVIKKKLYRKYKGYVFLKDFFIAFFGLISFSCILLLIAETVYISGYHQRAEFFKDNIFIILSMSATLSFYSAILITIWFFNDSYKQEIEKLEQEKLN